MQSTEHATGEAPCLHTPDHPEVARTRVSLYPLRDRTPPPEETRMRVSPYPLRVRTTPQGLATPLCARSRTPTSGGPPRRVTSSPLEPDQFQLIVKPIVKNSVGQNKTLGDTLSNFLVDGSTFQDILGKLRETFSHRIEERAVKQDGFWSMEPSTMSVWTKLMQFKYNNHIVDSEKTEHAWNLWVASGRGKTIKLMIYEYGTAITKTRDLDAFFAACIRPVETDRRSNSRARTSRGCLAASSALGIQLQGRDYRVADVG
ncbi:hypothetical protein PI124_g3353 [Phytophthora idaei]|nr:hypothetical protein PI125_g8938 [Phytophthora idaei]KAG3154737.1 hypothetical protein PI126_g9497 [Phytophthora idaei]KAG3252038.1 hypothetical protein PI124_g3353 [Phytophthora idaei]